MQKGMSSQEIAAITHIDPWFLVELEEILALEKRLLRMPLRLRKNIKPSSILTRNCCYKRSNLALVIARLRN
jgi:Carbamoyl-phosphate synthetase large chain, oligomerisation domain.